MAGVNEGERTAVGYLRSRGYHVLEQNFRCRNGEVDIIALDGSTLVFVEVKLRSNASRGNPIEAVTALKQRRIRGAAQVYLAYTGTVFHCVRFDVLSIMKKGKQTDITHLKAAFTA